MSRTVVGLKIEVGTLTIDCKSESERLELADLFGWEWTGTSFSCSAFAQLISCIFTEKVFVKCRKLRSFPSAVCRIPIRD